MTFSLDEMAGAFDMLQRANRVEGIFLVLDLWELMRLFRQEDLVV